jgi:phosphate starvation-inducible membrane PsiE
MTSSGVSLSRCDFASATAHDPRLAAKRAICVAVGRAVSGVSLGARRADARRARPFTSGGDRPMAKQGVKERLDEFGDALVKGFQLVAQFVIGATIVWSAGNDYLKMISVGHARLDDILLLFIYLELGTIVGIYFKTDRLPVLFLLYVAITALTRFLAVDVKDLSIPSVMAVTGSILVLTVAALIVQVAASRFAMPTDGSRKATIDAGRPGA